MAGWCLVVVVATDKAGYLMVAAGRTVAERYLPKVDVPEIAGHGLL